MYNNFNCTLNFSCGEVCSHVAGVLFKIEAAIRLQLGSMTCTSLPCLWNQAFSKKVQILFACNLHALDLC